MTNLLPPKGKTSVKWEYLLRVFTVWSFLCAAVFAATAFMLVPTYVLLTAKVDAVALERRQIIGEEEEAAYKEAQRIITETNATAAQLNVATTTASASKLLREVRARMPDGVTLGGFSYVPGGQTPDLQIRGRAATRQSLVSFTEQLEAADVFESATVPVSSLARDTDLSFNITLVLSEQK